jgi:nucleoid-associated protein YgaU
MSSFNELATKGTSALGSGLTDAIDSVLAFVPATLMIFLEPKVPIPIPLPILFNPEKLSFSRSVTWRDKLNGARNTPKAEWKGGGPERLTLKLFLDQSFVPTGIMAYIFLLKQLLNRPPAIFDQPPLVQFVWGLTHSNMSYVEGLDYEYTMFSPGGKPIQAEVTLRLVEQDMGWLNMLPINPTSRSEARKTWRVIEGQTLDWIAFQEYGDAAHWRHIAKVNNLQNPLKLRAGQLLKLTPLD